MEIENNITFLDVLVTRVSKSCLGCSVYRKSAFTEIYLHANSHHNSVQ